MISIISLLIITLSCLLFFKNQKLSVLGTILILPLYIIRLSIFKLPTTFLELYLLGIFIGFAYKIIKERIDIKFHGLLILLLLFLFTSVISVKVSNDSFAALGIFRAFILEPIIYFVIFINTFSNKKELETIIKTLGITCLYLSIYAIFQKITGIGIGTDDPTWTDVATRRVTSIFPYPNALGLFITPIVTLFLFRIVNSLKTFNFKKIKKEILPFLKNNWFNLSVFILGFLAVLFTKSSGALISIIGSICIYIFVISKNKLRTFLIGFTTFVLILTLPFTFSIIDEKVLFNNYSGNIRIQMWKETTNMLKKNFIFGGGLNNFKEAIQPYHNETYFELYLFPHNIILNFWSELGLLGMVSFFAIVNNFYKKNYNIYNYNLSNFWKDKTTDKFERISKYKKDTALIISLVMASVLIYGLVDVPFFKNDLAILFWIIIGIGIINKKIDDNIIFEE